MMNSIRAVLTMDVINSKKSIDLISSYLKEEGIELTGTKDDLIIKFLKYKCISINDYLWKNEWVVSDIIPLAGDSVQVICKDVLFIPEMIRLIRFMLRPLQLRIGIGLGSVGEYLFDENDPWNRSGNAFYNAREAIEIIGNKSNKSTYMVVDKKNIKKYMVLQESINTIFMLIDDIISKWSDAKWKSVQAYDKYGVYDKASKELKMTRQAVSKNCKAAKFDIIKEAEHTLKILLKQASEDNNLFTGLI